MISLYHIALFLPSCPIFTVFPPKKRRPNPFLCQWWHFPGEGALLPTPPHYPSFWGLHDPPHQTSGFYPKKRVVLGKKWRLRSFPPTKGGAVCFRPPPPPKLGVFGPLKWGKPPKLGVFGGAQPPWPSGDIMGGGTPCVPPPKSHQTEDFGAKKLKFGFKPPLGSGGTFWGGCAGFNLFLCFSRPPSPKKTPPPIWGGSAACIL